MVHGLRSLSLRRRHRICSVQDVRELNADRLKQYLERLSGQPVRVLGVARLGEEPSPGALKGYGYGAPLRVHFEAAGEPRCAVLATLSPTPFGHEHMHDRAAMLLWSHSAYNRLHRHVRSLDVGAFDDEGALLSLGRAEEFFLLTEFVEGRGYFQDLMRLRDNGRTTSLDGARADALCDYLVEIHRRRGTEPGLYVRRIRELLGHGECIMGLADSYPPAHGFITPQMLEQIEHRCLAWRWRLKDRPHRLSQVHGDFHPWNILFREGTDFSVLDRSRGEWGEPADDVTCLTMNYLFFSLQRSRRLEGGFERLFRRFWDRYLEATADREILEVAAPFFAFRGLVLASPIWYPNLTEGVRQAIFRFIQNVLEVHRFDPSLVNDYCGG
ncbi:MAG: phosphotransferase [Planctomycetes bacterium]|nr:phosphotransferase [Planctomycetota bacterium]